LPLLQPIGYLHQVVVIPGFGTIIIFEWFKNIQMGILIFVKFVPNKVLSKVCVPHQLPNPIPRSTSAAIFITRMMSQKATAKTLTIQ